METTIKNGAVCVESIAEYLLFTDDPYMGIELIKKGTYEELSSYVITATKLDIKAEIACISLEAVKRVLKLQDQTWVAVRDDMMINIVDARKFRNMTDAYNHFMRGE